MAPLPYKLRDIGAKIRRSVDHLKTLDTEIENHIRSEAYKVIREFNAKERTYTYSLDCLPEIPVFIRLLTGEVLTHLRSVLDHLAWQLALLSTDAPRRTTEFPIFKDPAEYTRNRNRKIGDIPERGQIIIDELQPLETDSSPAREDNALWVLHRLANDDKHRLPHLVAMVPRGIVADGNGRDIGVGMTIGPLKEKTEFGTVTLINPAESNMEMKVSIDFDLAFSDSSAARGRLVRPELVKLGKRVEEVIRKFETFF